MAKILRRGKKNRAVTTCPFCLCKFEIRKRDLEYIGSDTCKLMCPWCDNDLYLKREEANKFFVDIIYEKVDIRDKLTEEERRIYEVEVDYHWDNLKLRAP